MSTMPISDSDQNVAHILFSAFPAWGHVRPFCILATRLVKNNPNLIITLLLSPNLLSKAQTEISAEFQGVESDTCLRRIRVLSSFKAASNDLPALFVPLAETYATAYDNLSKAKAISCAVSDTVFDAVAPPNIVILDFFAYPQLQATRSITGHSVPIVSWVTGYAASTIRLFGPMDRDGHGDLGARNRERAHQTGSTLEAVGDAVYGHTDGTVVRISGIPPMYDWEFFPQETHKQRIDQYFKLPFSAPFSQMSTLAHRSLKECDAVCTTSAYALEKESIKGLRSWFSDWKKGLYVVGPLLPCNYGIVANDQGDFSETKGFLDKCFESHGVRSVMLVSFGTIFWPTKQEYIEVVVETLIEHQFPFIISFASPFAKLSDELIQRMKTSGLGHESKWFPQEYLLNHQAAGWFLTHGGYNSVLEALASGIPMICWPMEADQPAAAAHLTENLEVAFELIEVRTGVNGMKPILRNGRKAEGTREAVGVEFRQILGECRGEKGDTLRRNALEMRDKLKEAWEEDGTSRIEVDAFLSRYSTKVLENSEPCTEE